MIWILLKIDIILLKSGEGFSSKLTDLKIFKLFKKNYFWFHGADERAAYFSPQPLSNKNKIQKKYLKTLELKKT